MKKINKAAGKVFNRLLLQLGSNVTSQFNPPNKELSPLHLEVTAETVETPFGHAKMYRLYQPYISSGRQLMDPEMYFLVADQRNSKKDIEMLHVIPCYFLQDTTWVEEESIRVVSGKITNTILVWQSEHVRFANEWLLNLKQQGYLK